MSVHDASLDADEQLALAQAPPEESKPLFLQYAALEEQYGLARSAMEVYDKAVKTVPVAERLTVYELYLARAHEYFGLGKVIMLTRYRPSAGWQAVVQGGTWFDSQSESMVEQDPPWCSLVGNVKPRPLSSLSHLSACM